MWKCIKALNPFAVELRNTEARLEFARVLLAQAEIELADKVFYVREFAAVSAERDALKAENLRLAGLYGLEYAKTVTVERDALKTQLQRATDHNRTITEGYKAEIAALRERASVPVKVRWWGDTYDYDRLAEELSNGNQWCWNGMMVEHAFKAFAARAAIAHLSTRPEGLPTADELAEILYETDNIGTEHSPYSEQAPRTKADHERAVLAILTALRPWLRDPVGWELDVNCAAVADWLDNHIGDDHFRNWLRTRIRPVFECQECANWKSFGTKMEDSARVLAKRIDKTRMAMDAARAAERRALAREAYMAALGTLGEYTAYSDLVTDCQTVALETVRRWDSFLSAVDAEGGE